MSVVSLFLRGKGDLNNSIYKCDFTLNVLVKNPIQKGVQYVTEINYLFETRVFSVSHLSYSKY